MTIVELNILEEKAKHRKNGVYTYKGYFWVVMNNNFIVFADRQGHIYQRIGMFNVLIGKTGKYEVRSELINWLKKQKN